MISGGGGGGRGGGMCSGPFSVPLHNFEGLRFVLLWICRCGRQCYEVVHAQFHGLNV